MTLYSHRRDFNPVDALLRLQRDLESVFERPVGFDLGLSGRGVYPPVNIFRSPEGLSIRIEVPGFAPEQVSIESRGRTLVISGKPEPAEPASGSFHRRERPLREFSRSLQLPTDVEPARATASCRHGILTVHVPLREEVRPREIEVQSA